MKKNSETSPRVFGTSKLFKLSPHERLRISVWLSSIERVQTIDRGRWRKLREGSSFYLTHVELAELMDTPPVGYAAEIIRGDCKVITASERSR